ncbi:MAG TPA: LysR family transcriptional regulator, partial [Anaeromyxobacteraceae bacterium]|nr:LysR family transcriptional regulator [Anaeromyxobacteraceae bacterium]
MDRDQLSAFDRIVRDGSFTRAAVALRVGQPAVSARIRALEEQLGGALFTRGRRVALTALGESFLPFARRALEILDEGVEASRQAQVGQRGRIRLGTLASLAGGLVGPALAAFLRRHPAVECAVRAGDHERIVSLLLDGLVDVGVVTWPCAESAAAALQPLLHLREPVVLVAAPGHPVARRRRVTQDELAASGAPLVRLRWWQEHHPAIDRLAARTRPPLELPMETARTLVLAGDALGFFTRTYVSEDLARGGLTAVEVADMPPLQRDSALVRRRRAAPLSPATAALV